MTYPLKFRLHVLSVKEAEKLSCAAVAKRFKVRLRSIQRWEQDPTPKTTRNKPATKIDRRTLAQDGVDHPDAYHYERAQRFGVSTEAAEQRSSVCG